MSHRQNAGENHNMHKTKTANESVENLAKLKYFGMTGTNKNLIYEEIKNRLN